MVAVAFAYASDWLPKDRVASAFAAIGACTSATAIVSPMIGAAVAGWLSRPGDIWIVSNAITLVGVAYTMVFLKERKRADSAGSGLVCFYCALGACMLTCVRTGVSLTVHHKAVCHSCRGCVHYGHPEEEKEGGLCRDRAGMFLLVPLGCVYARMREYWCFARCTS